MDHFQGNSLGKMHLQKEGNGPYDEIQQDPFTFFPNSRSILLSSFSQNEIQAARIKSQRLRNKHT